MGVRPALVGLAVLVLGLAITVLGAFLAYNAYASYSPVLPRAASLDEAVTNTVYELLNLVLKLGFLGVMLWAGTVLLKNGLSTLVEVYRVDRGCSSQQS